MTEGAPRTSDRRRALPRWPTVAALALGAAALIVLAPVAIGFFDAISVEAPARRAPSPLTGRDFARLGRSVLLASGVSLLATTLALPAAVSLRRRPPFLALLALAPLLLPTHLAYAAWGVLRAPGTMLGSWVADLIARDGPRYGPIASHVQAILGLILWSWPIALIPMALRARTIDDDALDAAAQLSTSRVRRSFLLVRTLAPSALLGASIVTIIMLGSAIPLHLASVETYAIVVWRRLELTWGGRDAWIAATPLLALAVLAAVAIGACTLRAGIHDAPRSFRPERRRGAAFWLATGVLLLSTAVPGVILAFALREARSLAVFWNETGGGMDLLRSLVLAGVVSLIAATLAGLSSAARSGGGGRTGARAVASLATLLFLSLAFTPGVLIGSAILRASNTDATAFLADTPIGLVLAHVARFGAVAILAGRALARAEPLPLREARLLEGDSLRAWAHAALPPQIPGLLAAGMAVGSLSVHEIEAAALLSPPGLETFPRRTLSMLHYLRVEELTAAMLWTLAIGIILALAVAILASRSARAFALASRVAPLLALTLLLVACERPPAPGEPIRVLSQIGETGDKPGQLAYPRAITADTTRSPATLWIADRTGRVQRFSLRGKPDALFTTPAFELGKPVGLTIASDGLLYVADTHYHRVLIYRPDDSPEGATLVAQFGEWGTGPGQFIYPTDVALLPSPTGDPHDARLFVSEYGGNDRVSCFDGEFRFLFSFGREGSGASPDSIEFQRPQSLALDSARRRLFVTDSGNHRIGVFHFDGSLDRWIGHTDPVLGPMPGSPPPELPAPATFNFPYGLEPLNPNGGGDLLVVEYAACRVQRINPDAGTTVAVYGRPGRGQGELVQPWGVAVADGIAYLLDSRNNRVVSFRP